MALKVSNLSVRFGQKTVFDDLSLPEIQPGELISLIGTNGAGKSTLLKQITKSLWLRQPSVTYQGRALKQKELGYLPQDHRVDANLTVLELLILNLHLHERSLLTKKGSAEAAFDVLEQMQITHLANKSCLDLSGGESQMVGLAQAIINRPNVLILDEPTSALDMHNQLKLLDFVRKYLKECGACALMVVHDLNLALQYADFVAVLHQGELVEYGAPQSVISPDLLKRVFQVHANVMHLDGVPFVITQSACGVR